MKIKLHIYKENIKEHELNITHRPFFDSSYEVEITTMEKCDFILVKESLYKEFASKNEFLEKGVIYTNNDDPSYLYDDKPLIKLISQPSKKDIDNIKYGIQTIPILMTDHYKIHKDTDFINDLRKNDKNIEYYFKGQIYGKRMTLKSLKLENSIIGTNPPIYYMDSVSKFNSIKTFLVELSKTNFSFCPRGTGSNSFRLFESLMVGSIPIITDVVQLPYEDKIDWDSIAIIGSMDNINDLVNQSKKVNKTEYQERGMKVFDSYVSIPNLHKNIIDSFKDENN